MTNASRHTGMGSIPYKNGNTVGTTFRVWAEFATEVFVCGTFNKWSETNAPLFNEGDGYWSADIEGAKEGDHYQFVIKSPYITGGQHRRTDPYAKHVEDNTTGDGVIVSSKFNWEDDHFKSPAWNELVIYELHVASFNRSKTKPGNFSSIIKKLDYLQDLGINAIEILPIFGFPGDFSLGYNPALPFDIESNYGNPREFKALVKEAHRRGIAIILDIVVNHFGPEDLDISLWQFDGWNEHGKGGIYFYNDWRSRTAFGDRPDYGRSEVRQFLTENVMMWLDEYRIDGLRFDSTVNIRNVYGNNNDPEHDLPDGWSLMQHINNEINSRFSWKITIAEDLQNNSWITKGTGEGGAGFDTQWDSHFFWIVNELILASEDGSRNMYALRDAMLNSFSGDVFKKVLYINNHDECAAINHKLRLPDRIWPGNADSWVVKKKYTLATAIVFTTPGIPMIFMGDEFFEFGSWSDAGSLDWTKRNKYSGIWDLYKSLILLRRNWYNNTRGLRGLHINVFHVNNQDKLIAYHRWENGGIGDDVVVIANFSSSSFGSYTIGLPCVGTWSVRFNSDWNGYDPGFSNHVGYDTIAQPTILESKDGLNFTGNIGIGPYSVLIFSQ